MSSARAFMQGMIDYAGLFPPASLRMDEAVREYAAYRSGHDRDLLGRFIVHAPDLDRFAAAAEHVLPRNGEAWRISVVSGPELSATRDSALHFNCNHATDSSSGHAVCEAVEIRASTEADVGGAVKVIPRELELFLEVSPGDSSEQIISAIGRTRAAAKLRTGGVTADAFPSARDVLSFMRSCIRHDVRFKATAGLHHAVAGDYALTYAPDAPRARMFGYLNVFLAAAFLEAGFSDELLLQLLEETSSEAFRFDDSGVSWRGHRVSNDTLRAVRNRALSYGSCSFKEPIEEARKLGLLVSR